jgi:hypothetical protein
LISFRYHLVSIVAVLLALGIGIVLGSGFVGGVVLRRLRAEVARVTRSNEELRARNSEQDQRLETYEGFARETEAELVADSLAGRQIVVFTMDGTDAVTLDGLREVVEIAGGSVAATVRATQTVALESPEDRSRLASILGTSTVRANELRRDLGLALGNAAAAVAAPEPGKRRRGSGAMQNLDDLLLRLVEAGFLTIERPPGEQTPVPSLALFLIVEGAATDPPPRRPLTFTRPLATSLSRRSGTVLVAEPSTSMWDVVGGLRADGGVADRVATVDHADTVPGRVATALGLRRAAQGRVGHYGSGPGAESVVPQPAPLAG